MWLRNACISGCCLCLFTCDFRRRTAFSTMRELGLATLAESVTFTEGVEESSTSPLIGVMPAGLAVTIADAS